MKELGMDLVVEEMTFETEELGTEERSLGGLQGISCCCCCCA